MPLAAGDYLDRFRLIEQAGEGAQGTVWKALDERNGGRLVALKLHRLSQQPLTRGGSSAPTSTSTGHLDRLRREADSLRRVQHPSLVRCLGMFEDFEHDLLGLVLEWIEGQSLTSAHKNPTLSEAHRMWLLGHLIRALAHLHAAGLVHRDLKFGNVMVVDGFWSTPSDPSQVKLVDLGIAAPVGNPNPLTQLGTVVGTSAYVAPEIVMRGKDPSLSASPASDVFAFGLLGWRLLTGEHPTGLSMKADFTQFIAFYEMVLSAGQRWPARGEVHGPWGSVLRRCLRLPLNERAQSAVEVVDILEGRAAMHPGIADSTTEDDARPQLMRTSHPASAPGPVEPWRVSPGGSLPQAPPSSSRLAPPLSSPSVVSASPSSFRPSAPPASSPGVALPSGLVPLPSPSRPGIQSAITQPSAVAAPEAMFPTTPTGAPPRAPVPVPMPAPLAGDSGGTRGVLVVVCVVATLLLVAGVGLLLVLRR